METDFQIIDISRGLPAGMTMEQALHSWSMSTAIYGKSVAQSDFSPSGAGESALSPFLGPCAVVDMSEGDDRALISASEVRAVMESVAGEAERLRRNYSKQVATPTRLLFRTCGPGSSNGRFFSRAALDLLFAAKTDLVGVDTNALEPLNGAQDLVGEMILKQRCCLLNLNLGHLQPGILYHLVAPPILATLKT